MRIRQNEKGLVLLMVVVFTWFLFALVGSYFIILMAEKSSIFASANSMKAEAIAEAAIEELLWEYNYGGADFVGWAGGGTTRSKASTYTDAGGGAIGSYTITVDNFDSFVFPYPLVTSTGTFDAPGSATTAVIKAQLKPRPLFPGAIVAKDIVTFTGNAFTDSYKSTLGPYNFDLGGGNFNVFQNGDVITAKANTVNAINVNAANGNPVIAGDASPGPLSTVSDPSKVSGVVSNNSGKTVKDVAIPANMLGLISLGTLTQTPPLVPLPAGDYKFDAINIGGNDVAQIAVGAGDVVRIWTTGTIVIGGSGQMRLAAGATLIIYAEGNINAGGNGIANLSGTQFPQRLQIYGTPTCTSLSVSGGPDLITAMKAPQAAITISGTPAFYGAFIGFSVTATGGGGVHYDEQLLNGPFEADSMELDWMRRV